MCCLAVVISFTDIKQAFFYIYFTLIILVSFTFLVLILSLLSPCFSYFCAADVWTFWSGCREEEVNYSSKHQCCKRSVYLCIYLSVCITVTNLFVFSACYHGRRSAGNCPVCWAVRSPPCSVCLWSAGLQVRWWH